MRLLIEVLDDAPGEDLTRLGLPPAELGTLKQDLAERVMAAERVIAAPVIRPHRRHRRQRPF